MTERLQPKGSGHRTARRRSPGPRAGRIRDTGTIPVPPPTGVLTPAEPTILGFPAEFAEEADTGSTEETGLGIDASSPALTVLRRADWVGAAALVSSGVAANVSLVLSWSPDAGPTGLSLVKLGIETLRFGSGDLEGGFWQPPVIVLSGGLLLLLGILLLVPARTHRLVGVVALVISLAATAAVVHLMVVSGLADDRLGPGMWCAVAVPVLGVLGSLKAMLTVPLVTLDLGGSPPPTEAGS